MTVQISTPLPAPSTRRSIHHSFSLSIKGDYLASNLVAHFAINRLAFQGFVALKRVRSNGTIATRQRVGVHYTSIVSVTIASLELLRAADLHRQLPSK